MSSGDRKSEVAQYTSNERRKRHPMRRDARNAGFVRFDEWCEKRAQLSQVKLAAEVKIGQTNPKMKSAGTQTTTLPSPPSPPEVSGENANINNNTNDLPHYTKNRRVKVRVTKSCLEIVPSGSATGNNQPIFPSVFFSHQESHFTRSEEFHVKENRKLGCEDENEDEAMKPRRSVSFAYGESLDPGLFDSSALPKSFGQTNLARMRLGSCSSDSSVNASGTKGQEGGEETNPDAPKEKEADGPVVMNHPEGSQCQDGM